MIHEVPIFHVDGAILAWAIVFVICLAVALLVGFVASLSAYGLGGPKMFVRILTGGLRDLIQVSPRRIGAIATLTFKEALRRKAFLIGLLFLVLFMFGGWFLSGTDLDKPAKPYVAFVMTAMSFLLILMSLLISCWGLPADIKDRSLHTVVTKPVRRSEIVIGRMLGYSTVLTIILVLTSLLGYAWIRRQVPDAAQNQLIARVPVYGQISFVDRNGEPARSGVNVGDIWEYRSFIEGGTKARAFWVFENLNVDTLRRAGNLRLEQSFEAFRTYKGKVDEEIRYSLWLLNPEKDLRVLVDRYPVREFTTDVSDAVVEIPAELPSSDSDGGTVNVFDDLMPNGKLVVEVACVDEQQYLGTAQNDLFVRMPDRTFLGAYAKASIGLWLMLVLIVMIGTTASCFVKGPVATLLTATAIFVGYVFKGQLNEMLLQLQSKGQILGGGTLESVYRIFTRMNQTTPLPENAGTDLIKSLDQGGFGMLRVINLIMPDLTYFNTTQYPANGFDVPFANVLLPSILITLGYFLPLVILGYFSLQLRELEHK
ncbi:MAG: hypothetical protein KDA80_09855 [Planctomycetaceae bacterium]|nr:hypothetical protein [Planctomycetaceae bacterium]